MNKNIYIFFAILGVSAILLYLLFTTESSEVVVSTVRVEIEDFLPPEPVPEKPRVSLITPSSSKTLQNDYHVFQTFNNCGPAAMSMALSYYGINQSQQVLGQSLRPYQNSVGDNDDKSVTLQEIAIKAKEYDLIAYRRPNGNTDLIKKFITYDIPVITRTWLKVDDDIGHFRVIKGYNDSSRIIVQDDSLQGKNLTFSYNDFNAIWKKFNYEYLVLIPLDKKEIAEAIIGEDVDEKIAWTKAVQSSLDDLRINPNDIDARFNLSVAYYNIGDYKKSIEEFEKVEDRLTMRTLWYQIEPIRAYYEAGEYDRVFEISEELINNHNRAFSEMYILRGKIYEKRGDRASAEEEFEKATFYNKNASKYIEAF